MKTDYIQHILTDLYEKIENKDIFIPIVFANTVICYKLAFYDRSYWMEFSHGVLNAGIILKDFEDIIIFFDGFVKQTPQFEFLYNDTLSRLREYEIFFGDFRIKQKFYYKHPEMLEKHMFIYLENRPDENMIRLGKEIMQIAGDIKFKKTES